MESEKQESFGSLAQGSSGKMWTTRIGGSWRVHGGAETTTEEEERVMLEDMLVNCVGNEVVDERLLQLWLKGFLYASAHEREAFVNNLSHGDRALFFRALSERTPPQTRQSPGAMTSTGSFAAPRTPHTPSSSSMTTTHLAKLRRRAAEDAVGKSLVEEAEDS